MGVALRTLRRHGSWVMGNTTIFRRRVLIEAGRFIPELGPFCDGFIHQVIALRHGACFIPEPLACWRRMETGYATSTSADFERMMEIRDQTLRLMRSTYRDLFPADYVASWEKQWSYWTGVCAWGVARKRHEHFLTEHLTRLRPQGSWLDRLFVKAMQLTGRAQGVAVRVYLLFALGYWRMWLTHRANDAQMLATGSVRTPAKPMATLMGEGSDPAGKAEKGQDS